MIGDWNAIADIIPVDYSANMLLAIAWHRVAKRLLNVLFLLHRYKGSVGSSISMFPIHVDKHSCSYCNHHHHNHHLLFALFSQYKIYLQH